MVNGHVQRTALFLGHGKAGSHGRARGFGLGDGLQAGVQRSQRLSAQAGTGLHQVKVHAAVTQPGDDGLRHLHLRAQAGQVSRRFFVGHQHGHLACA